MTMTKITYQTARKLYNNGTTIYLMPSKAVPGSAWITPVPVTRDPDEDDILPIDFDTKVNAYRYYNCNRETGMTVHYYINP